MSAQRYFEEIVKIPRPSGHEEKMREYLREFAASHHFACIEDEVGNILIRRGKNPITLQGHMDMVPEAIKPFDFLTQGITTRIEEGWMYAEGTTLGADNGVGVALMLWALTTDELADISLECLFTVDEEEGMTGAEALSSDMLEGDVMINLDHEDGNSILIGCAGGVNTDIFIPKIPVVPRGNWYTLTINGLKSGHSGLDIGLGRANAIKLVAEFLEKLGGVQVAAFSAGSKCNVIPKEAVVTFSTSENIYPLFSEFQNSVAAVYKNTDPSIFMKLESAAMPAVAFDGGFVSALNRCQNGVLEFDSNGVLTSSNLAVVMDGEDGFSVITLQRSAKNESRDAVSAEISRVFEAVGGDVTTHSPYSDWILDTNSPLLALATETYRQIFGREPRVETTHAGVECGVIQEKYPNMQIISLGPTIEGCHTVHERLSLCSLAETERFLAELLKRITV